MIYRITNFPLFLSIIFSVISCIILFTPPVFAETEAVNDSDDTELNSSLSTHTAWVLGGIGAFTGRIGGISMMLEVCYQRNDILFSIRGMQNGEFKPFSEDYSDYDREISALIGYSYKGQWAYISFSAGIGGLYHVKHSYSITWELIKEKTYTVGLPLEVQMFLTPIPILGIGIIGFCNLNFMSTSIGFLLCLQIGYLWPEVEVQLLL